MKAKRRKWGIEEKAKYVEQTSETLPAPPAKLPRNYCKRLKGEHVMELVEVNTYKHYSRPYGYPGPLYVSGWTDWKEYRCTGCNKKQVDLIRTELDAPVVAESIA